jgi:hypothetical protein
MWSQGWWRELERRERKEKDNENKEGVTNEEEEQVEFEEKEGTRIRTWGEKENTQKEEEG